MPSASFGWRHTKQDEKVTIQSNHYHAAGHCLQRPSGHGATYGDDDPQTEPNTQAHHRSGDVSPAHGSSHCIAPTYRHAGPTPNRDAGAQPYAYPGAHRHTSANVYQPTAATARILLAHRGLAGLHARTAGDELGKASRHAQSHP